MTLFNIIKNNEVIAIYVAEDINLVPCQIDEIVEEHSGQYHIGWKKINEEWIGPDHPNYPK